MLVRSTIAVKAAQISLAEEQILPAELFNPILKKLNASESGALG